MNENRHVHNEEIEEDIEVGDIEEIEHEEGVHAEATKIHISIGVRLIDHLILQRVGWTDNASIRSSPY